MEHVYEWLEKTFLQDRPTTIIELGAHTGEDTQELAEIRGSEVHAFEPDPRLGRPKKLPQSVAWHRCACGATEGWRTFYPSATRGGQPWTCSGSLRKPTGHFEAYPDVIFGLPVEVPVTTLDVYCRGRQIEAVDLLWMDVQGAEDEVLKGAQDVLTRTRYLYTEYSDTPLYEGQPALADLRPLLPGWRELYRWPSNAEFNVLLENPHAV